MNRSLPVVLFVLSIIVAVVSGCTNGNQTGPPASNQDNDVVISTSGSDGDVRINVDDGNSVSANGMTICYPESFVREDVAIENSDVRIDFRTHKLVIANGVLKFDDKEFGSVEKGDRVEIKKDGSIVVNSKPVNSQ